MTGLPLPDLAARLFRPLYSGFELRTAGTAHVAVPQGTPWFAGDSLGEVAGQISSAPGRRRDLHHEGPGS